MCLYWSERKTFLRWWTQSMVLKNSLQQHKERLNTCFFYQEEIEKLASFGGNHYHKFWVKPTLLLNNSTKSEYINKTESFFVFSTSFLQHITKFGNITTLSRLGNLAESLFLRRSSLNRILLVARQIKNFVEHLLGLSRMR